MNDRYFVLWPDGQKFGPADVPTLQRWAVENRIGPATLLEDAQSGRHVRAVDIPPLQSVLNLPMNAAGSYPGTQPGFVPSNPRAGTTEVTIAWILGAIGLFGMFCCVGPTPAIAGLIIAIIAKTKNQQGASAAMALNIAAIVINVLIFGLFSLI